MFKYIHFDFGKKIRKIYKTKKQLLFYIKAVIAFTEPKLYAVFYSLHKFSLRICPIQLILATISKSVISKRSANISLSDGIYLSP